VLGAVAVGAPHRRDRIWIVAHTECAERGPNSGPCDGLAGTDCIPQRQKSTGWPGSSRKDVANADSSNKYGRGRIVQMGRQRSESAIAKDGDAARVEWSIEPGVGRVADGVAARVDRLTAIGNGQVPQCAAEAFRRLMER
jgi:DNA (cytosine-5)-methyltransferase 1